MTEPCDTGSCSTGFCGTGGWAGPLPGDPGELYGLTATPVLGGIDLSWFLPNLNPHAVAYTSVYRSNSANYANALKIADTASSNYFDQVTPEVINQEYFYWVQQVSVNGTLGPLVGPASAVARPTNQQLLELLVGQVEESHLNQTLTTKIANIQLFETNLDREMQARLDGNTALQEALSLVNAELGSTALMLNDETILRTSQNLALVNAMNVVTTNAANTAAAIVAEAEALTAQINLETTNRIAAISEEVLRASTADEAVKTVIRSEFASGDATTYANAQAYTNSYTYAKATIDGSISAQGTTLSNAYQLADATKLTEAKSYAENWAYSKSASNASEAAQNSLLRTEFNTADGVVATNAQAYVQGYSYSKTASDQSLAARSDLLRAEFAAADGVTYSNAQAYVQGYSYAKSTVDGAIAASAATINANYLSRANVLKNGSFENGMVGWTRSGSGNANLAAQNSSAWGPCAFTAIAFAGTNWWDGDFVAAGAGWVFTLAGDTEFNSASGSVYFALVAFDNANNVLANVGSTPMGPHGFGNLTRQQQSCTLICPAGTTKVLPRFVTENITGGQYVGFRLIKMEFGHGPPTPYTQETGAAITNAAVKTNQIAIANAVESVASSATTLRSEFNAADTATNANLSNNYYTRAAADAAIVLKTDVLEAKIRTRPNLLKNGGFESGLDGWSGNDFGGWAISTGVWGQAVIRYNVAVPTGALQTESFPVAAGVAYTITGDSVLFATSGNVYFDIVWLNSSDGIIGETGQVPINATHDFTANGENRATHAVSAISPVGATKGVARFVWDSVVGLVAMGCRQVKVERGGLPATPYTSEGSQAATGASVKTLTTAIATANASIASTATTLRTEFGNADAVTLASSKSYVENYAYSIAQVDSAQATQTNSLRSEWQAADTNQANVFNATLTNNYYTKAATDSALVTSFNQLSATLAPTYQSLHTWDFKTNGLDIWGAYGPATLSYNGNGMVVTVTGNDSGVAAVTPVFDGLVYNKIRVRFRKVSGTANWQGAVYYGTTGHWFDGAYFKEIPKPANLDAGEWCVAEWDMIVLNAGGIDFLQNIYGIRVDFDHGFTADLAVYEIDWISVGRHGTPISDAAVTEIKTSIVTGDSANATAINLLKSSVVTRPNLLGNGGFELGMEEWTQWHTVAGHAFTIADSAYWGRVANISQAFSGTGVLQRRVNLGINQGFCLTCDSELYATSGTVYLDLLFFNSSDVQIGGVGAVNQLTQHGFSTTNSNRDLHAIQGVIPVGTSYSVVRCVYANVVGGTYAAFRQIKIENGPLPASPYTAETTMAKMDAAIKTEASTRATEIAAQATLTTTLQSTIGKNRANLLKNSSWEAGTMTGWAAYGPSGVFVPQASPIWGPVVGKSGVFQGTHSLLSNLNPAGPGYILTASGDTEMDTDVGNAYFRLLAFNASSQVILYGTPSTYRPAYHQFGSQTRVQGSTSITCPAGTAFVAVEIVFENVTNCRWMAARQFKLEAGPLPATPYSTEASLAGAHVALQQEATTRAAVDGTLLAQWSVKTDLNGYIAGFGLSNTLNNATPSSTFLVRADTFAIGSPTGPGIAPTVPFIVKSTTYTDAATGAVINAGVYMNGAYIVDLNADRINVGQLKAARIDTRNLDIKDAAGNVIFSSGANLAASRVNPAAGWLNSNVTVANGSLVGIGTPDVKVDNSYVAQSKNLIPNSDQTSAMTMVLGWNPGGATINYPLQYASQVWSTLYTLRGNTRNVAVQQGAPVAGGDNAVAFDVHVAGPQPDNYITVVPGQKYILSVHLQGHRCNARLGIAWFNSAGSNFSESGTENFVLPQGAAESLDQYLRPALVATAPAGAMYCLVFVRKLNTYAGQTESWLWIAAPQFEPASANQTVPSAYVPGPVGKVGQLGYTGALNATHGANWNSNITGQPGDNTIQNSQISISGGQIWGIGTGASTVVANSNIGVANGRLTGIGTGDGASVDNTHITDNVVPDPQYRNHGWWGVASWGAVGVIDSHAGDYNRGQPLHYLTHFVTGGTVDYSSLYMTCEQAGSYRLKIRIWASPDAAGIFWAGMHLPWQEWFSPLPGTSGDPVHGSNLETVKAAMQSKTLEGGEVIKLWTEYTGTRAITAHQFQFRIRNGLTSGSVAIHFELQRVSNFDRPGEFAGKIRAGTASTFIDNAAIGSAQIGQLLAGNLAVTELSKVVSGGVVSGARVQISTNKVEVFDGVNGFARVTLGYIG